MSENTNEAPVMMEVDMKALGEVLRALVGPGHLIRELQVTRGSQISDSNPIDLLIKQYNAKAEGIRVSNLMQQVTPYNGELAVGCVVEATNGNQLRSGASWYKDAVVISMEPFIMTSRETDMCWSSFDKEDVTVVGKVSDEYLKYCQDKRLAEQLI